MNSGFLVVLNTDGELILINIEEITGTEYSTSYVNGKENKRVCLLVGNHTFTCHHTITMEDIICQIRHNNCVLVTDIAKLILEKKK